jgi:hypothetical protein
VAKLPDTLQKKVVIFGIFKKNMSLFQNKTPSGAKAMTTEHRYKNNILPQKAISLALYYNFRLF